MTDEDLIAAIQRQEQLLVLDRFTDETAHEIGSALRAKAVQMQAPVVIDIRSSARRYYFTTLPGSTPEGEDWARRKGNTVLRCHMSSMRVGLLHKVQGVVQWPDGGLNYTDFVNHGGGFPITIKDVGVIGVIAISGLPSLQDHELSTGILAEYLNLKDVALPKSVH